MASSRTFHRLTSTFFLFFLLYFCQILSQANGQQNESCDTENPCIVGCCSRFGSCGFGTGWCDKDNCIGTCNAKAECGKDAAVAGKECPLNVCCSKWGFCGTTEEFCNSECQGNKCVLNPFQKTCPSTWMKRRVAYYETWAADKECDSFRPERIPAKAFTHLNIAFGGISTDHKISLGMIKDASMIRRITRLKGVTAGNPALQIYIAVGGWAFNDPGPTRTAFSDMVSTAQNRQTFINSVMDFLETHALDGIDFDWEYPGADDRGGKPEDVRNYVTLISGMRAAFDKRNPAWGISMAIPASYWYLQHFDIKSFERSLTFFNLMSYDIHGKWDQYNIHTGPYVLGHTNLTEIQQGLDLLRRNDIDLKNVNLGMGFYGRTFTLEDAGCNKPGCVFSDAGIEGECSGEGGILTFKEIMARTKRLNQQETHYDEASGVKYMVLDGNQWITYDDAESFKAKREFMDKYCIGGVMIWAVDQDTDDFQALAGLLGDEYVGDGLLEGGLLSDEEKEALANQLGGLTGDNCYITQQCAGKDKKDTGLNTCRTGFVATERVHQPLGTLVELYGLLWHESENCKDGQYHTICCNAKSPPQNCEWRGAPERSSFYCDGGKGEETCGPNQYELATDKYMRSEGGWQCASGARSLCCDSLEQFRECKWSACKKDPIADEYPLTYRGDNGAGKLCPKGESQVLSCPEPNMFKCSWKPYPLPKKVENGITMVPLGSMQQCNDLRCPKTALTMARSTMPDRVPPEFAFCANWYPGLSHRLCCDVDRDEDMPFNPNLIWDKADGEDILWSYADHYGNNDADKQPADEDEVGDDPYGFVALEGDPRALQNGFQSAFTFVHENDGTDKPIIKRENLLKEDPDLLNSVFAHEESEHLIYCKRGREKDCEKVFFGGANDTIITLPRHIGSGPFARIVHMKPVHQNELPKHHLEKRSQSNHDSTVYTLKIDYAFDLIKRADSDVRIRVDYTNLMPYWDEMTGKQSGIGTGIARRHEKRWWGEFKDWLRKLTKVESSDMGKLPMAIRKKFLLYRYRKGCPRGTSILRAGLDVTAETKFDMNARWAYYLSGSILPTLDIRKTYAYFGVEPMAEVVLEIKGSAQLSVKGNPVKIIDTLSWPGLAVKGIAAVGPTLDIYGRMEAAMALSGELRAGARVQFPKYEMYYPQDDDSEEFQQWAAPRLNAEETIPGASPILDARVRAQVDVDFILEPTLNLGIRIGGSYTGTLLDAQLQGIMTNTINFHVEAQAGGGVGTGADASYLVLIRYFYNFAIGGYGTFIGRFKTAVKSKTLFPGKGKERVLYRKSGSVSSTKRSLPAFMDDGTNSTLGIEEDWYSADHDYDHTGFLEKRIGLEDVSSFAKGLLECNDNGQCQSGGCNGGACDWKPGTTVAQRRRKRQSDGGSDGGSDGDPMDTDDDESCIVSMPAMMYNCRYFPDVSADVPNAPTPDLIGICHNILNHMNDEGLNTGPFQGRYHTAKGENSANREKMCGRQSKHTYNYINTATGKTLSEYDTWSKRCQRDSDEYAWRAGDTTPRTPGNQNYFSCDEFPFNSWEEGGDGVRACVPGYQQEIQGQCNGLPGRIIEQVEWEKKDGTKITVPRNWDDSWNDATAAGVPGMAVDKDTNWNWQGREKQLTFHLFDSTDEQGDTPLGTKWETFNHEIGMGGTGAVTDIDLVIAAINPMDTSVYSFKGNKNAFCETDETGRNHKVWGTYSRGQVCLVEFDNNDALTKLRRGEKPTTAEMFNIKRVVRDPNEPIIEFPKSWVPPSFGSILRAREEAARKAKEAFEGSKSVSEAQPKELSTRIEDENLGRKVDHKSYHLGKLHKRSH